MQLVLSTSGINGYSSTRLQNYSLASALTLCGARDAICQSKSVFDSWRRHGGNYCDDHCSPCSAESARLHHCQKSTSSRYYRLTRLHVRSIDSIDRLDFSAYPSSGSISRSSDLYCTEWDLTIYLGLRYVSAGKTRLGRLAQAESSWLVHTWVLIILLVVAIALGRGGAYFATVKRR